MESYPFPHEAPYPFPFNGGRLELGDPLYTSPVDGPELRLISQQLTEPTNYHSWVRDLRRALVTKAKEGFIEGIVPFPTNERLQRHWRHCNQLVRTWIGNCLALDVAADLPPTEDSKNFLNESYTVFRSQILAMEPQPTLGRIFQLAMQEENQRVAATEQARVGEGMGFAAFPSGPISTENVAGAGGVFGAT